LRDAAVFFLLIFLAGATQGVAQNATILGTVRDASGAVVPQATLTARNVETGQTRTTVSGADGAYRFSALPVGNYEVTVEQSGFQSAVRSGLTLTVGREALVNFSLQVGAVEQRVEVTAEAPLVNTTTAILGEVVDEQKVSELPLNGRNYADLALLQPGVQKSRVRVPGGGIGGTGYSSNGAPLSSNQTLLDGARANSMVGGSTATSATGNTLGIEGIQEFKVVTNALSAEYGMAMGSQMVIVSKGGTNNFHGSLFEYHRNDNLDARNFFDRRTDLTPGRLPPFVRNNFGGSIGGPIVQDKTFFHTNLEMVRERKSTSRVADVLPSKCKVDGGCVPRIHPVTRNWLDLWPDPNIPGDQYADNPTRTIDQQYGQVRIDHTFSGNDSMFGRYTVDDSDQTEPRNLPGVSRGYTTRAQFLTIAESHIVSPTVINQFNFSYSRSPIALFDIYVNQKYGQPGPEVSLIPGQPIGVINVGDLTEWNPSGSNPSGYRQKLYSFSDDVYYTAGAHSLKFGALINKFEQFMEVNNETKGTLVFPDVETFLLGQPENFLSATPGAQFNRDMRFTSFGFYVQDDWRMRPGFTLNLGLRYEFTNQPTEANGLNGNLRSIHDAAGTLGRIFVNNTKKNFSPRVGFAWDVTGNATTAVRGGFGILYDLGNLGQAIRTGSINPPFASLSTLESDDFPAQFVIPIPIPAGLEGKSLEILDYNLKQPRVYQWNLTVERQMPFDTALSVGYVGTRGVRLHQMRELNPRTPEIRNGQRYWEADFPRASLVVDDQGNPRWEDITGVTAGGGSWYNGLQVGFSKRLSNGLQFQNSYTWSHVLDDIQGQTASDYNRTGSDYGADPGNNRYDWGPSAFDYTHNFASNAIYHLPDFASSGMSGKLLNGWWVSGILTLNSGFPVTVVINRQWANTGIRGAEARIDRPNMNPNFTGEIVKGGREQYYDPAAFQLQPQGTKGNSQRGQLRGPGFATVDFSVVKDTALGFLGEAGRLEFRAEFFNLLNRVNFEWPERRVFTGRAQNEAPTSNAGVINNTLGTSRQVQLALKVVF
jgi:hypothetical protein